MRLLFLIGLPLFFLNVFSFTFLSLSSLSATAFTSLYARSTCSSSEGAFPESFLLDLEADFLDKSEERLSLLFSYSDLTPPIID